MKREKNKYNNNYYYSICKHKIVLSNIVMSQISHQFSLRNNH